MIFMKLLYQIYHLLFKTRNSIQAGHIQLREFSQSNDDEQEIGENENLEPQQQGNVDEIGFREINQEGKKRSLVKKIIFLDADAEEEEDSIEADVIIE